MNIWSKVNYKNTLLFFVFIGLTACGGGDRENSSSSNSSSASSSASSSSGIIDSSSSSSGNINSSSSSSSSGMNLQPVDVISKSAGHPNFMGPHSKPIVVNGDYVYVTNTPSDTVDIIERSTRRIISRINVGIEPVGIAVRPDGKEVWVTNHVSDSVSVIDTDATSFTFHQVIATVQDINHNTKRTNFDEPVGIAFASNAKAYVALSTQNRIAIIDVAAREVTGHLNISAQDPRAIAVHGNRLYVLPFESNNQTQLSGCTGAIDGDLCTFDAGEHVRDNNNVLSTGYDADIIKHPSVPDRDLYVFNTDNDQLVQVVDTLGTLLYGITVDSNGKVFVAQTDARNDVNGRAGTQKHGLAEMENRAFLNQITEIDCRAASCSAPVFHDLEPLPPEHPAAGMALATPFAIQISDDDSTIVATAASSNKLFTVNASTGELLGRVEVDWVPRGIALESDNVGAPDQAWVLNAVANTVSFVDLSNPAAPSVLDTINLDDPTDPEIKLGRFAFHNAEASTTGTFSCESCHPDGHTDQLLWVLDTPICDIAGCTQIPPRSTMPVRGLRDTAPYHWDGIPGDPYGGNNTANIRGNDDPNCNVEQPETCTRFLVDGGLGATMCDTENCPTNENGQRGALSEAERAAMAKFLLAVPFPPAPDRAYDNALSNDAERGFELFHIRENCGNCHRMPFWVSTNTPGTGMDAPTWRGAYDRWLTLPQGRWNVYDLRVGQFNTGIMEHQTFFHGAFGSENPQVWQMVREGSTGFSGAFGRQVTINQETAGLVETISMLNDLEQAARDGAVLLEGEGVLLDDDSNIIDYLFSFDGELYQVRNPNGNTAVGREWILNAASSGGAVFTVTARVGLNVELENPQPAIWSVGHIAFQTGRMQFMTLNNNSPLRISGRHIEEGAHIIVNGKRVEGTVQCESGDLPNCADEIIIVQLAALPSATGMQFLQIQNPDGLFSNDYIFHTTVTGGGSAGSINIPAIIQAENFVSQQGIQVESTRDTGGGSNVGYIDEGDWFEYRVNVPASGEYNIRYRIASLNGGGQFRLEVNGAQIDQRNVPSTGDWQAWSNIEGTVNLEEGEQTLRFEAIDGGWNINWFELSQ